MQTDTLAAFQVEEGDYIVFDNQVVGKVTDIGGEGDGGEESIIFTLDDDGETSQIPFPPFDTVTVVSSFLDPEDEGDY